MKNKRAVVLLSGGLDSATTLFIAKQRGYECYPLVFDYGQRHRRELRSASYIAKAARCRPKVLKISLPWRGSSLIGRKGRLPKSRSYREIKKGIPSSYVPARNTIFLSFALSFAESIGARKIFIGANAVDFSGYPDCRGPYLKAFEMVIKEGTKAGVEGRAISIEAPLLLKTKGDIVKVAESLRVPYSRTWSCYRGGKRPCGQCDSCVLRKKGFVEAGLADPLVKDE
ncbi:MAG: 7-cyano-7-deazaguanine synthase QueC [Candidatus Omnitrophota bacterium]